MELPLIKLGLPKRGRLLSAKAACGVDRRNSMRKTGNRDTKALRWTRRDNVSEKGNGDRKA